jgi:hypothetical protein
MHKLQEFKIGGELGRGVYGTVYDAIPVEDESLSGKYVIKIEKTLANQISVLWENEFAFEMGLLYPDQFVQLHDYLFSKHYKYNRGDPAPHTGNNQSKVGLRMMDGMNVSQIEELKKLDKSRWTIFRLYTRVDTSLDKIEHLNTDEYYSLICQFLYINKLIVEHDYRHGDFHAANIGVCYTDQKKIKLGDYIIPTFGKIYKCIDYGEVTNYRWYHKLTKKQKNEYEPEYNENIRIVHLTIWTNFWNLIDPNHLVTENNLLTNLRKHKLPPEIKISPPNRFLEILMYQIFLPKIWQKMMIHPNKIGGVKYEKYLPDDDYYFICQNWNNSDRLIQYFSRLRNRATCGSGTQQ